MKYTKNAHYWQKGKPKIDTVYYPAYTSNDPANQDLASGKAQWGSQFIPSINAFYLSKSKDNHYWFPPVANVSVFINLKNPILKDVAIRRAMAYAIDRSRVVQDRRVRLRAGGEPDRHRDADLQDLAEQEAREEVHVQPDEGEADPHEGRLQVLGRCLPHEVGQAALVHDDQHRRLFRLGRLGADRRSRT